MALRVAIIGAGPCGLGILRAFEQARREGAELPDIVCYEKQSDWGGLWNYTWRTGIDGQGEAVHGSMYRYLWSNGPKECLEFADYTFDEHFGKPIPSFPPREVLYDYILGRAKNSDIKHLIVFDSVVRRLAYDESEGVFLLTVENLAERRSKTERFDRVVVACGHFSIPNVPYFKGIERFPGRVMHAHDFRDAREFEGKNVLIVGSSYSAEDIGLQCYKYGAKSVTMSYRTKAMGFKWPDTMREVPLLMKLDGKTAHFKDGTTREVDAIVLCTGYQHSFPFIDDDLRLRTNNRLYPNGLYKGVVWAKNPKLLYLGMQDQYYTFSMFDLEAWYARDVIMGRIQLPPRAEMEADIAAWQAKEDEGKDCYDAIDFQTAYCEDLAKLVDYPDFDLKTTGELFKEWEHDKDADIVRYRDKAFRSPITGTMSPVHHTPWIEALDDSMRTFLDQPRAGAA
ncbi:MAG: NAD(P)/FAD-dependent oxidoreductase [Geminicoccaceae bacterium]|nr:NAD(P)/FAD-dependent oxidoreductase [Geminicoccaceae bacterium]